MADPYITEEELAEMNAKMCSPEEAERRTKMAREVIANMRDWPIPQGRAHTPEMKAAVMRELLAAWLAVPEMRLCQLIANALSKRVDPFDSHVDIFYVEDETLLHEVQALLKEMGKR